ncbi:MAG: hypothetical protein K8R54_10620 [Bacteroidales bacterium]|nr:hypothetical protein [Bacteroidales bacterium]
MKKYMKIIWITAIICFSGSSIVVLGNNSFPTKVPDKTFKVSSKSKTVKMVKGQTYRMKMKLRENRYYFLSVKGKKSLGCVQYKIINANNENSIIFDNSAYEFDNNMTFYNEFEREVIVEIRTMPCCLSENLIKKYGVKLLFANKKLKKNEDSDINNNYNLYAIN